MSVKLVVSEDQCCGCGTCSIICPRSAITMCENDYGFLFPVIDHSKCIECGACTSVCQYHIEVEKHPVSNVFAAAIRDNRIMASSSGGVFAEIAHCFISSGGVVVGAAMIANSPQHVLIDCLDDIPKLQGSKYAQSDLNNVFSSIKEVLNSGIKVLFSGTPCQVAGLKSYLRRDYANLYTVDVICHGVPSSKMFHDYLKFCSRKYGGTVLEFRFRDKRLGWGTNMRAIIQTNRNLVKERAIAPEMSSYFSMFLRSDITRDSCIGCRYASKERVADISLGDYWGIHIAHPEAVCSGYLDDNKGISCVFINTSKGQSLFDQVAVQLNVVKSDYSLAVRFNGQAEKPVQAKPTRRHALDIYKCYGYSKLDSYYWEIIGKRKYYYLIKNLIPRNVRLCIKKKLGK